jgi:hypothetical protein
MNEYASRKQQYGSVPVAHLTVMQGKFVCGIVHTMHILGKIARNDPTN